MAVFIDTGVWVAARNLRDDHHDGAVRFLERNLGGTFGRIYTSDYVFGQAIILALVRSKQYSLAQDIGNYILECPVLTFLFTPESIFRESWMIHAQYQDKPLSFTDCTIIAWCHSLSIDLLAGFDTHFDGILKRVTVDEGLIP